MTYDDAKQEVKQQEPTFLEKAKNKVNGHNSYVCPACGNGSGKNGTGIALDPKNSDNGKRYTCFKCNLSEDVIGLWKIHKSITDDREAFSSLYSYYGIDIKKGDKYQKQYKNEQYTHNSIHINAYTTEYTQQAKAKAKDRKSDMTSYIEDCHKQVKQTNYFSTRGISSAIIDKYKLGYDPEYFVYANGKGTTWKAAIIPTGSNSIVVRNTDLEAESDNRYRKKGTSSLFNAGNIASADKPIFIVEGEIDALSIIEAGGEAIGLGSTSNYKQLLEMLMTCKTTQPLILALDKDNTGEETTSKLKEELSKLSIVCIEANLYGDCKDANEALLKDRDAFKLALQTAEGDAISIRDEALNKMKEEYLKTSAANNIQNFLNGISARANTNFIPTGFEMLDRDLEGGLYEGLYVIGAISSLGKTTFILQIADQIAQQGQDVIIFSLEMAREELMAKSISRLTFMDVTKLKKDRNPESTKQAKTARGITTASRYKYYSADERDIINRAIKKYYSFADHIYIHEGIGDIGAEQIREVIDRHITLTGNKPVVIIDYLQILAPADIRGTDKQNTDKSVLELKRISRDFKIPVIGISAVNRANYKERASMEMFKESGAIEYGSDCLIGLQLRGAGEKDFNVDIAKSENPRQIELVILKQRNGATGRKCYYEYFPMFNFFYEY